MTAPLDLEALAATVARMTAGEWALSGKLTIRGGKCRDGSLGWVGKMIWSGAYDAAGIVALKNAAPALIAETQALRERVRVLEEAFGNVQTLVTEAVDLERIGCVTALDAISDIARAALGEKA
jgi:hypothetical protein